MSNIKQHKAYRTLRRGFKNTHLYLLYYYILAQYRRLRYKNQFNELQTYCLFIGHGRSGHSIFGALLDAHENAIVADEIDTLRFISAGFNRELICQILLAHSEKLARRKRTKHTLSGKAYSYSVPGQWQGKFNKLKLIGDSKAAKSVRRLEEKPKLLSKLKRTMKTDIKVIHILRNPYDNISTLALKDYDRLEEASDQYFRDCDAAVSIRKYIPSADLIRIKHEDLIRQPKDTLIQLCEFIGLRPAGNYVNACTSIIYTKKAKSRLKINWDQKSIQDVKQRMEQYEYLAGYSYTD